MKKLLFILIACIGLSSAAFAQKKEKRSDNKEIR